jgi:hypothetical protein
MTDRKKVVSRPEATQTARKFRLPRWSANRFPDLDERYQDAVNYIEDWLRHELALWPVEKAEVLKWAAAHFHRAAEEAALGRAADPSNLHRLWDVRDHLNELADTTRRRRPSAHLNIVATAVRLVVFHYHLTLTEGADNPSGRSASHAVAEALKRLGWTFRENSEVRQVAQIEVQCSVSREDLLWPLAYGKSPEQSEVADEQNP